MAIKGKGSRERHRDTGSRPGTGTFSQLLYLSVVLRQRGQWGTKVRQPSDPLPEESS
jgi:hypothetical protein